MLIIPNYVSRSKIHGLGVFAAEFIPQGARIWEFNPIIDVEIDIEEILNLPVHAGDTALLRSFCTADGKTILSRDNGVFLNHSDHPNTISNDLGLFAARSIEVGEEITENYRGLPSCAAADFLRTP